MNQNDNGQNVFHCQNCGRIISPSHMYCSACGAKNPWYGSDVSKNTNYDDLPVINTDEIFGSLDYIDRKQENKKKQEEDLPVINTDGLFDDVPFADTTGYQNRTVPNNTAAMQYYSMGAQPEERKAERQQSPYEANAYQQNAYQQAEKQRTMNDQGASYQAVNNQRKGDGQNRGNNQSVPNDQNVGDRQ
ncbi:MAG: hypothetical protein Q4G58_07635, partial [bacterium]|nr:hypothetical protein [bacterium]